jgi:hypothetical protein
MSPEGESRSTDEQLLSHHEKCAEAVGSSRIIRSS